MIAYLVVEEPSDERMLRSALPAESLEEVRIVPAGGLEGCISMGRTLLSSRRKPLAVIFNSDATSLEVIVERSQNLQEVIGILSGRIPFRVIAAIPTMEDLFLDDGDEDRLARRSDFLAQVQEFLTSAREYADRPTAAAR